MDKFLDLLLSEDNLETNTLAAFVTAFCCAINNDDEFNDWISQLNSGSKEYNDLIGLVSSLDLEIIKNPHKVLQKYKKEACALMVDFDDRFLSDGAWIYINKPVTEDEANQFVTSSLGLANVERIQTFKLDSEDFNPNFTWLSVTNKGKKNQYLIEIPFYII